MSYMFEKDYRTSADDGDAAIEPVGRVEPVYHDYLATYVSLEELASRRRVALWTGLILATLFAAGLGLAAYVLIGG